MTTAEILAEWKRLCDAATEGPWHHEVTADAWDEVNDCPAACWIPEILTVEGTDGDFMGRNDVMFIAASRTAMPLLITALNLVIAERRKPTMTFETLMRTLDEVFSGGTDERR